MDTQGAIEDIKLIHLIQPDRYHIAYKQGGRWFTAHIITATSTYDALKQINHNEQVRNKQKTE